MNQDFTAPPMGGENIPYRDLAADQFAVASKMNKSVLDNSSINISSKSNKNNIKYLIIAVIVILFFILIILVVLVLKSNQNSVSNLQPTPTSTPEIILDVNNSNLPQSVIMQVDQLNNDIKNVDLQELDLTYPNLDWEIIY